MVFPMGPMGSPTICCQKSQGDATSPCRKTWLMITWLEARNLSEAAVVAPKNMGTFTVHHQKTSEYFVSNIYSIALNIVSAQDLPGVHRVSRCLGIGRAMLS